MVSKKLVREIERNAGKLATDLVEALRHDRRASAYEDLTDAQYRGVVRDLYSNLGDWLESRTWNKLRKTYELKGRERCHGGMPLEQLVYSLTQTKHQLLEFIRKSLPGESSDHDQELNLVLAVSDFFDRAIYHTICGYEDARRTKERVGATAKESSTEKAKVAPKVARKARKAAAAAHDDLHVSRGGDVGETSG